MSRLRKLLRAVMVAAAVVACGAVGLAGYVEWNAGRTFDAPYPPLVADARPEAIARGHKLFDVKCAGCHRPEGSVKAIGKRLGDLPPDLGTFYSANLTRDPGAGVGARSDAELARAVRYGVTHDGRRSIMGWALSDDDLAAVLGYLRSDAETFDADSTVQPHTRLTFVGKAVLAFVFGDARPLPAQGIVAPSPSSGAPYGEYLAKQIYDCADCHTPGYSADKANGPDAFRGGTPLIGADGRQLFSRNLTFHETGLAGWTEGELARALKDGLSRDGQPLRAPMPRLPSMDETEVQALYLFLESLPHRASGAPERARPAPTAPARPEAEALFEKTGCAACHAAGAPLEAKVIEAKGRDVATLTAWIRNAQAIKPGTPMPNFETVLSEAQARTLATWISAGRPGGEPPGSGHGAGER